MRKKGVIYIWAVAVETDSLLTAAAVLGKIEEAGGVRGTVEHGGEKIRWSTIQQYERHGGFEKKQRG